MVGGQWCLSSLAPRSVILHNIHRHKAHPYSTVAGVTSLPNNKTSWAKVNVHYVCWINVTDGWALLLNNSRHFIPNENT